jgi:hypothetical protein
MAASLLFVISCVTTGTPEGVYDAYIDAYADGDAERMWKLVSPTVHADTLRVRANFLAVLSNPDPATRVPVEGTFGVTAKVIQAMDARSFYVWAVHAIRQQLSANYVRQTVSRMSRVRVESLGANDVHIVYLGADRTQHRMHIRRLDGRWYVNDNPFSAKMTPEEASEEEPVEEGSAEKEEEPSNEPVPSPQED